jgi:hypothetical protein
MQVYFARLVLLFLAGSALAAVGAGTVAPVVCALLVISVAGWVMDDWLK